MSWNVQNATATTSIKMVTRKGKQNYICVKCGRQLLTEYQHRGYSNDLKRNCWKKYVNGMGFRAIERITGVSRTTIMDGVKLVGTLLPDAYERRNYPRGRRIGATGNLCWKKKSNLAEELL
ncbi:MAG: IS1 family transposase [Okeania sp. SIO2G4]|nr:IS1 family transposase [Okeania sp. SIO2G5]NEP95367.1 IS1 family transposase [Okeania sp. SIO2F5]NEQ93053.1 IS1 family transposase [Okeania sp. SIO2G4]